MSTNLIPIKAYLGKYYQELLYSAGLDKYNNTKLVDFFDQRFYIQDNKVQMIVDPGLTGLSVIVTGNEIHISKELYDHPNVNVINSLEKDQPTNPRSLYNPETFSTLAYLVCQNHLTFQITGEIDEPLYVKYKTEFESFYNSVVVFDISDDIGIEIVEEIESVSALNIVSNYVLNSKSRLNLRTFYRNHISGISFFYRNVIAQDRSSFDHVLFGKGSSNIIDETKIHALSGSASEMMGVINSDGRNFHSILSVDPQGEDYSVSVNYKEILAGKADVSFYPIILGSMITDSATIDISSISLDEIPDDKKKSEVGDFIADTVSRAIVERVSGTKRFYDNKSKFLHFL